MRSGAPFLRTRFSGSHLIFVCAFFFLVSSASAESSIRRQDSVKPKAVSVSPEEVKAHRISEIRPIRTALSIEPFESMEFEIIVDESGAVISLECTQGPDKFEPEATAQIKALKYRPFERDGASVRATFSEYIQILPLEKPPTRHVPFPQIVDRASVRMSLSRSACMGDCPAYKVTISGDGTVNYEGDFNVAVKGQHRAFISSDAVSNLIAEFRAADFFSMNPRYSLSATDLPTFVLSFAADGKTTEVVDYLGEAVGMPEAITRLEQEIDRVSHSARWVEGNGDTFRSLADEKFDFKSDEAADVLREAASRGEAELVRSLLSEGTPVKASGDGEPDALGSAAKSDHLDVAQLLLAAPGLKWSRESLNLALIEGAATGDVELIKLLIKKGANPRAEVSNDAADWPSAIYAAAVSGHPAAVQEILKYRPHLNVRDAQGSPIILAASDWRVTDDDDSTGRAAVIAALVRAGADVNARDENGDTALHSTIDGELAKALIAAGADVNAKDNDGDTPLTRTVALDVARALVEAGANTSISNDDGKTIFDIAPNRNWGNLSFLGQPPQKH
jgi:ankyrin repeat protein